MSSYHAILMPNYGVGELNIQREVDSKLWLLENERSDIYFTVVHFECLAAFIQSVGAVC